MQLIALSLACVIGLHFPQDGLNREEHTNTQCPTAQCAQLQTYIFKLSAYSPSKGAVGTREVAVVAANLPDAEFKVSFIQTAYLKEVLKDELGGLVTRELISVRP
jgi:hypothetical protein